MYENCPGSRSQNALCTAVTAATSITDHKGILIDPRSTEEILADELPIPDALDAMEKTAIRSHTHTETTHMLYTETLTETQSTNINCPLFLLIIIYICYINVFTAAI